MPLDPQIAPLVEASNATAAELPPVAEQSVTQRREAYLALADLAGPGPDIARVENVVIAGVPCRLYAPAEPNGVIVYFHGGGFTIGDLDTHDEPCRQVAQEAGATLIAVDYRRAPEYPFPAGLDDAWSVFSTVAASRDSYPGGGKLVVIGDSAGGNFAAVLALMARDAGIDLAAQLLVYPSVDMLDASPSMVDYREGYVLSQEILDWFNNHYQADPTDWRASPILAESHVGVAPALVITGEYDMMRDQGIAYAERLRIANVDVIHTNYEGMVHAFFQLGPLVDAAKQAVTQVASAARAALA